ncbi:hypothetical protein Adt_40197 [Abeliophyllum distichum]|uniref:Uncharacterized protein n=1 Tax=Abeliophyllum distichum TaxID=126358 RepID=A0ABD1QBI5_9LAMI
MSVVAPLPVTTPPKFCCIYRTRVHNTEDCPDVRKLINRGAHGQGDENRPTRGRRGPPIQGRRPPPRCQDNGPHRDDGRNDRNRDLSRLNGPVEALPVRKINTIIGGPCVGGYTMNSRRNYTKVAKEELMESWQVHGHRSKALQISFTEGGRGQYTLPTLRCPDSPCYRHKERTWTNAGR